MFFIAGISSKIKPCGITQGCECPACGRVSPLHVIYKYMTPHIFFIPTFHFRREYLATCASCASVMELNVEKGHAFSKNHAAAIEPRDLIVLQDNSRGNG